VVTNSQRVVQSAALFLVLAVLAILSACGAPTLGTVTSVAISSAGSTVLVNDQVELTADVTVAGQNSSTTTTPVTANTTVTWYVEGTAGGSTTYGTIVLDPTDAQAAIYTAPQHVPSTNSGQVTITATANRNPNGTAGGGANTPITSNSVTITISPGLGLQILSPPTTVPAGGSAPFNATLNGLADPNATWTLTSSGGGTNIGTMTTATGNEGVYQAPSFPPPGDVVTITATDSTTVPTVTASTNVQITYSDPVLNGSFAFSYTGNDSSGFLAAAGSFVANGSGGITGGIEDISSFRTGVNTSVQIENTSTYTVGTDGRGIATLNTTSGAQKIAFVLTTNQHAIITRFDSAATGSGTMDQQNFTDLGGAASAVSGPYVFSAMGTDASFNPEAIAGEFSASGGTISAANSQLDIHDGATSSATITTNAGLSSDSSYAFDTFNLGTGRGTLTLNTPAGALQFAFYIVDSTELYMVEIDGTQAYLAGSAFSAVTGAPGLASANYVMTAGGMAPYIGKTSTVVGSYAAGAVFTSSGSGTVSSGILDVNNQGNVTANATIGSTCGYTVNSSTGRIDLKLCPSGTGATNSEFAMYPYQVDQTDQPGTGFLLVEIDPNALTSGVAFQQTSATLLTGGGFALGLAGQGIVHGSRPTSAQNVDGHFATIGSTIGDLDVNFFAASANDPLTSAALSGPGTIGRGTFVLTASSPPGTYNLIYYLVSANEALLFDQDANSSLVLIGTLQRQF
jgi:hypothetical protein